jgi:hypothetical protein
VSALVVDEASSSPPLRHAVLLSRLLAEAMIAGVQSSAALSRAAADELLAQARLATPLRFIEQDALWRASWRSFELSAETAERVLGLASAHIDRSTLGLWRVAERLLVELGQVQAAHIESLRDAFDELCRTQAAYLGAAQQTHQRIIALAQPATHGESHGD